MSQGENKPVTIEDLQEQIKTLNDRLKMQADGWARDVRDINSAFGQVRSENHKLAERIAKLEADAKKNNVINE